MSLSHFIDDRNDDLYINFDIRLTMQECPKCHQMIGKGFYQHEKYCNGTPKPKKEPDDTKMTPLSEWTGTSEKPVKTYYKPEPEPQGDHKEHKIDEARIVHKSDVGIGAVIVVVVIFIGLFVLLSHIGDIIHKIKSTVKDVTKEPEPFKDSFDNPHGVGFL